MSDLNLHIKQRVKDILGITSEEISSSELYDQLFEIRNLNHPDKFIDEDSKKQSDEKFKTLNSLLIELRKFIETENQQKKPNELILYKEINDNLFQKHLLIVKDNEIEYLKERLADQNNIISKLKNEIHLLEDTEIKEKTQKLIDQYKPSRQSLISSGILFLAGSAAAIVSKIDSVANTISKYFPFGNEAFNYFVFSIFLVIPFRYLSLLVKEREIRDTSHKILTPHYIQKFLESLDRPKETFSDLDVYKFLESELMPKTRFNLLFDRYIYKLHTELNLNSLKDLFIHNLLSSELVTFVDSHLLRRYFKIRKSYRFDDDAPF